jgi:ABC-type sugar transport system ATPase subunit
MAAAAAKLQMSGISKSFPGVRALRDVSLEVRAGEIVGLVGVNGAGKSTLMNVLGGIHRPDAGEIRIDGKGVVFNSPKDAGRRGISFIHQELLFFASQTVAENIFISHLFKSSALPNFVSKAAANREARRYLDMLGSRINPTARLEDLSAGDRQIVEIARALAMGSDIVILDEPTSSLSLKEKHILFDILRRLKREQKAIVYISHFLDEIMDLCDRFVVLRNGEVHGDGRIADVRKSDIIRMIIGRELVTRPRSTQTAAARPVLAVEGLRSGHLLREVSLELGEGEILGVWGLMGSGRTELLRCLLGLDPIDDGRIRYAANGRLEPIDRGELLAHCGYITESRHADGLFLAQPVWKNVTATALDRYARGFWRILDTVREMAAATGYIESLRIATGGSGAPVETLSGGNQQKVVFAKWLHKRPRILVMDEPTRGVDVGAKLEIHGLIADLAQQGAAVLLVSSEVEEMVNLCDRVLVLRDGCITSVVTGDDINNARLMALALGEDRAKCVTPPR